MTDKDLNEDDFEFDDSCRYAANLAKQFGEHLKAQGKKSFTFGELRAFDKARFDLPSVKEDPPSKSQFPQYECTKKILALKIRKVEFDYPLNRLWVSPVGMAKIDINIQIGCVDVGKEYIKRFSPDTGGYYIKDENGSESYCSGDVFEFLFSVV